MQDSTVVVVGMGEVGKPLFNILSRTYHCVGVDVDPVEIQGTCEVLHICYPFQIKDFVGVTAAYIAKYAPKLTIINSTLGVGTTRQVQDRVASPVAYSPVRGKHIKMEQDMLHYKKFVAGFGSTGTSLAAEHFAGAGFKVATFPNPEAGEISKLMETTWLGVLVGWAQEIERMAAQYGATYADVNAFIEEIAFLPTNVFPGYIGGHCVMPNIEILRERFTSQFLEAIVASNDAKAKSIEEKQSVKAAAEAVEEVPVA